MGSKEPSLFDYTEYSGHEVPTANSLTIGTARNKKLSESQQTFNKLTMRIEQLQKTIQEESASLEALLKVHMELIPNRTRSLADIRLRLAKALGNFAETIKFGKKQMKKLRDVILNLCNEAFSSLEPDEETEKFYDNWSDTSYQDEVQFQTDMMKQEIADQAREVFGIDIDLEDIDDTPESFARLARKLQERAGDDAGRRKNTSERNKSKKQIARDEMRKKEEELTQRSMRSIFLSLAKALHPDTVTDLEEKAGKEELMKKVTAAYAGKDLSTLLRLEMEWVRSESKALGTLPDDQLKLYISAFREQVAALEQELEALRMAPRFECISDLSMHPHKCAVRQIHELARAQADLIKDLEKQLKLFAGPSPKQHILAFINYYCAAMCIEDPFLEDFISEFF